MYYFDILQVAPFSHVTCAWVCIPTSGIIPSVHLVPRLAHSTTQSVSPCSLLLGPLGSVHDVRDFFKGPFTVKNKIQRYVSVGLITTLFVGVCLVLSTRSSLGIIYEIPFLAQPPWFLGSCLNTSDSPLMVLYWLFSSAFPWSHLGLTVGWLFTGMNQRGGHWHRLRPPDWPDLAPGGGPVLVLLSGPSIYTAQP